MAPLPLQYFDGRTASVEEVNRAIREDGAAVVTHAVAPATCDAVLAELRPFLDASARGTDPFSGLNTRRTTGLIGRSRTFGEQFALNRFMLAAAGDTLLPYCDRFRVMATQAIHIGPGSPAQPLHRDRDAWGSTAWLKEECEPELGSMWALTDFTEANGATRVVPRTHIRPLDRDYVPSESDMTLAVMPKGSVLIYTGSVLHSGGANTTADEWRMGVHLSYSLGWLRSQENQYLSVPPRIARTLDPDLQELIGYSMARFGFGYFALPTVDDVRAAGALLGHPSPGGGELPRDLRDVLSPEIALGRKPRRWDLSAGVDRKRNSMQSTTALKEAAEREAKGSKAGAKL
ncbi:hypothetical protein DFJ74DRAFT_708285 [Hyaloraphidium curvatum]|nr:hypothetical protein DFJ74DRAFT_708285 [Hyaloraphidium curvatum]